MVIRTILEDRMLQAELPGFRDYVQQVRYPPLPGVWCGALWFFPDKERDCHSVPRVVQAHHALRCAVRHAQYPRTSAATNLA